MVLAKILFKLKVLFGIFHIASKVVYTFWDKSPKNKDINMKRVNS